MRRTSVRSMRSAVSRMCWCLASLLVIVLVRPADGLGFSGEFPVWLVNHRDIDGNLVWPTKPRRPVAQSTGLPHHPHRAMLRTPWGMSAAEVKKQESASLVWEVQTPVLERGELRLGYATSVEGLSASLTYVLLNDRLREMKYLFEVPDDDGVADEILGHYETVRTWIVRAYGEPTTEEYLWLDTLYRHAPDLWGKAVMRGHLTVVSEWQVAGTSVTLLLNGDDDTVGLLASFTGVEAPVQTRMVGLPLRLIGL